MEFSLIQNAGCLQAEINQILLDRFFENLDCASIVVDNEHVTFEGTMHLVDNGFKNIGFITTTSNQTQMKDRLSGYKKAIAASDLRSHVLQIPYKDVFNGKTKQYIEDFMNSQSDLDAVFFLLRTILDKVDWRFLRKIVMACIVTLE